MQVIWLTRSTLPPVNFTSYSPTIGVTTQTSETIACNLAATPSDIVVIPDLESRMEVTGQTPLATPLGAEKSARYDLSLLSTTRRLDWNPDTSLDSNDLHAGTVSDFQLATVAADRLCCTPPVETTGSGGSIASRLVAPPCSRSPETQPLWRRDPNPLREVSVRDPVTAAAAAATRHRSLFAHLQYPLKRQLRPAACNPSDGGSFLDTRNSPHSSGPVSRILPGWQSHFRESPPHHPTVASFTQTDRSRSSVSCGW